MCEPTQAIAKTNELVRNPITDFGNTTRGQRWDIRTEIDPMAIVLMANV